jgi:hypothetical protein
VSWSLSYSSRYSSGTSHSSSTRASCCCSRGSRSDSRIRASQALEGAAHHPLLGRQRGRLLLVAGEEVREHPVGDVLHRDPGAHRWRGAGVVVELPSNEAPEPIVVLGDVRLEGVEVAAGCRVHQRRGGFRGRAMPRSRPLAPLAVGAQLADEGLAGQPERGGQRPVRLGREEEALREVQAHAHAVSTAALARRDDVKVSRALARHERLDRLQLGSQPLSLRLVEPHLARGERELHGDPFAVGSTGW